MAMEIDEDVAKQAKENRARSGSRKEVEMGNHVGGGPKTEMFGEVKDAKGNTLFWNDKIAFRFDKSSIKQLAKDRKKSQFSTGFKDIDDVFGKLPFGLTIFVGEAGTGKSYLAKHIARKHKTLYISAEALEDMPEGDSIIPGNYTEYLPNWKTALGQLLVAIDHFRPELVVIDSGTRFFSSNKKAIEEADLRPAFFDLAKAIERKVPVIAISEVRGSGWHLYPAGGQAINHSAHLLIWFSRFAVRSDRIAERLQCNQGDVVWAIEVMKDKRGLAKANKEYKINYEKDVPKLTVAAPEVLPLE